MLRNSGFRRMQAGFGALTAVCAGAAFLLDPRAGWITLGGMLAGLGGFCLHTALQIGRASCRERVLDRV